MKNISKFIDYRPNLQYVYDEIATKSLNTKDSAHVYLYGGSLASEVDANIVTIQGAIDKLLEEAKSVAGPLYDEYKAALELPYSHDKYEKIEELERIIADVEGNIALEALPILEDLKEDWKNIRTLFDKTVVALMNEEFPDGDMQDKELKLDELCKTLAEGKKQSDITLTELYCGDLNSQKLQDELKNNKDICTLLEDAENLTCSKIDLCNVIDTRYYDTLELLYNINRLIYSTPQGMLDKQLVDVLQYILVNINPFDTTFVVSYLKNIQSILRLTLDGKINNKFSTQDKMKIVSSPSFKTYLLDTLKNTFLYRQKISTKVLQTLEQTPEECGSIIDMVMDNMIDGVVEAENNYKEQMVGFDKLTKTDIIYKTTLWGHLEDKELTRVLYKVISNLIDYISKSNTIPEKKDLATWLTSFCQMYKLNVYFDSAKGQQITLF